MTFEIAIAIIFTMGLVLKALYNPTLRWGYALSMGAFTLVFFIVLYYNVEGGKHPAIILGMFTWALIGLTLCQLRYLSLYRLSSVIFTVLYLIAALDGWVYGESSPWAMSTIALLSVLGTVVTYKVASPLEPTMFKETK